MTAAAAPEAVGEAGALEAVALGVGVAVGFLVAVGVDAAFFTGFGVAFDAALLVTFGVAGAAFGVAAGVTVGSAV